MFYIHECWWTYLDVQQCRVFSLSCARKLDRMNVACFTRKIKGVAAALALVVHLLTTAILEKLMERSKLHYIHLALFITAKRNSWCKFANNTWRQLKTANYLNNEYMTWIIFWGAIKHHDHKSEELPGYATVCYSILAAFLLHIIMNVLLICVLTFHDSKEIDPKDTVCENLSRFLPAGQTACIYINMVR